jgi:predicted DNA-binding transcriptional regulator YafY
MSKSKTPSPRQLLRLLDIDELIRSEKRQTIGTLAVATERSERTIRNDLDMLRDSFKAPLVFTRPKGYHYTDAAWRLPTVSLTQGELFALTLGARMLASYAGSAYVDPLRSAIEQLSERLPESIRVDLQQVGNEQILFRVGAQTQLNPEIWQDLELACREQMSVQMTYFTASRNATSERRFDPYLLDIYRGTNPCVIGFCHHRQAIRWFRIDRIRQLQVLSTPFKKDSTFDPKTHLENIFQHEVGEGLAQVRIWFDAATAPYIRERRWHKSQVLQEQADGAVILELVVSGLNDIKRWVLGYGQGARVLGPPELVAMVQGEIAGMQANYQAKYEVRE